MRDPGPRPARRSASTAARSTSRRGARATILLAVNDTRAEWWGTLEVPMGSSRHLQVGPLDLWIGRAVGEWQVSHRTDPNAGVDGATPASHSDTPSPDATARRYALAGDAPTLRITPRTADRPTVIRPVVPLTVLAGQEVHLFCSLALWVELAAGPLVLATLATQRPSDTWFGPNTREGELCYASSTAARLDSDQLPPATHRAVARITLRNRGDAPMPIERIKLPVTGLPLFVDAHATLWLPALTLVRHGHGDEASLTVDEGPPPDAGDARPMAVDNARPRENALIRALGAFWR